MFGKKGWDSQLYVFDYKVLKVVRDYPFLLVNAQLNSSLDFWKYFNFS